jgi:DNA recombination protein RmuC
VEDVYVQEGKDRSALAAEVKQLRELNQTLSEEAKNLTTALKGSNKTQGNYGEMILERVLEASGLRKGLEYHVQVSHQVEGKRQQPDVIIHLPEERHLVVDSKISLDAYQQSVAAADPGSRERHIKEHIHSVQSHIKGLSSKNYQELYGVQSPDFVLLFMPLEPAFLLAVTHEEGLFMDAWNRNVLLVSPSTLLFVVRTVAHLWRQEAQKRNAQEIAQRGADLYDKLVGFVKDFEDVGSRLAQAQKEYDSALSKFSKGRGNVIRQAELLRDLGPRSKRAGQRLRKVSRPPMHRPVGSKRARRDELRSAYAPASRLNCGWPRMRSANGIRSTSDNPAGNRAAERCHLANHSLPSTSCRAGYPPAQASGVKAIVVSSFSPEQRPRAT